MLFGEKIKQLRKLPSRSWSQGELGKRTNLSQGKISAIETLSRPLPLETQTQFARIFEMSLEELLENVEWADTKKVQSQEDGKKEVWMPGNTNQAHTSTMRITRVSSHRGPEDEIENELPIEENVLDVHVFVTTPAVIGVQYQATDKVGDERWEGIRVYTQRPCYNEEVEETRVKVIEESKRAVYAEMEKLNVQLADAYRQKFDGERKEESYDGSK